MSVSSRFRVPGGVFPFFDKSFVVFLCSGQALFVGGGAHLAAAHTGAVGGRARGAPGHSALAADARGVVVHQAGDSQLSETGHAEEIILTEDDPSCWQRLGPVYGFDALFFAIWVLVALFASAIVAFEPSLAWWERRVFLLCTDLAAGFQYAVGCLATGWIAGVFVERRAMGKLAAPSAEDREKLFRFLARRRRLNGLVMWVRGLNLDEVMVRMGHPQEVEAGGVGPSQAGTSKSGPTLTRAWVLVAAAWLCAWIPVLPATVISLTCAIGAVAVALSRLRRARLRASLVISVLAIQAIVAHL